MKKKLLFATLFAMGLSSMAQNIVYVDVDATGNNDGSSWANAYNSLFSALEDNDDTNSPVVGLEIWMAEGVYTLKHGGLKYKIKHAENIYGGFTGTETNKDQRDIFAHPTILSGDISEDDTGQIGPNNISNEDNSNGIIDIESTSGAVNQEIVLDGLIIERSVGSSAINSSTSDHKDLRIENCIIRDNWSDIMPAIRYYSSEANSSFKLFNTQIIGNSGGNYGFAVEYRTLHNGGGHADIVNCHFENNTVDNAISGANCGRFTNLTNGKQMTINLVNNTMVNNTLNYYADVRAPFAMETTSTDSNSLKVTVCNNVVFDNGLTNYIIDRTTVSQSGASIDITASTSNVIDFVDYSNLQQTTTISTSPFQLVSSSDFRVKSAFQETGDTSVYLSYYPEKDIDGEMRKNNNGKIDVGAWQTVNNVSLESLNSLEAQLYPNPVQSVLHIIFDREIEGNWKMYSATGGIVKSSVLHSNNIHIDVTNLPKGIYYFSIESEEGTYNKKVVLQ